MKKLQVSLLLTGALVLLLISCKKDPDAAPRFTGTYDSDTVTQLDLPRMYTKNGVLTNQDLIREFIQRDRTYFGHVDENIVFGPNATKHFGRSISVNFTGDSAYATYDVGVFRPTLAYFPERKGQEIVLRADSTTEYIDADRPADTVVRLLHSLEKNNTEGLLIINHWSLRSVKGKRNLTLLFENDEFRLPILHIHLKKGTGGVQYWRGPAWTYFNPEAYRQLEEGDTLVVQTGLVKMIRQ